MLMKENPAVDTSNIPLRTERHNDLLHYSLQKSVEWNVSDAGRNVT